MAAARDYDAGGSSARRRDHVSVWRRPSPEYFETRYRYRRSPGCRRAGFGIDYPSGGQRQVMRPTRMPRANLTTGYNTRVHTAHRPMNSKAPISIPYAH